MNSSSALQTKQLKKRKLIWKFWVCRNQIQKLYLMLFFVSNDTFTEYSVEKLGL